MNHNKAAHHTKRVKNRLKPVSYTCTRIFQDPNFKDADKQLKRCFERLDRALGPGDTDGPAIREALAEFPDKLALSCNLNIFPVRMYLQKVGK